MLVGVKSVVIAEPAMGPGHDAGHLFNDAMCMAAMPAIRDSMQSKACYVHAAPCLECLHSLDTWLRGCD